MKKILITFLMMAMMAIMVPLTASTADAQTRKPSIYRKHRNLINIGIGTGAGALIGALLGGKKGAGIGALVGAGSSALYTYKLNPKTKRYYRVRRYYFGKKSVKQESRDEFSSRLSTFN